MFEDIIIILLGFLIPLLVSDLPQSRKQRSPYVKQSSAGQKCFWTDPKKSLDWFRWHYTPSLSGKSVNFAGTKTYYLSFIKTFHADFNHIIFKMIPWPK